MSENGIECRNLSYTWAISNTSVQLEIFVTTTTYREPQQSQTVWTYVELPWLKRGKARKPQIRRGPLTPCLTF